MAEKRPKVTIEGVPYLRLPIKTDIVREGEDLAELVANHAGDQVRPGDIVFVSESVAAISQGRAIPEDQIRVGWLARILWRFVRKVPYGVGLRSPETMQAAIDETGRCRILFAALVGALGKLIGRRGDFYRIAGMQAALIDGAHTSPIEPYDRCVIKGPLEPDKLAREIGERNGCQAAIVDVNDIGGSWVIGASPDVDRKLVEAILRDNPLGQGEEQTPFGIIRELEITAEERPCPCS